MSRGTICEDKTTEGEERRRGKPLAKVTTSDMRKERRRGGHNCRGGVEWHCVMCVLRLTERQPDRETDDTQQTAGWKQCTFMLTLTLGLYLHGGTLNILQAA